MRSKLSILGIFIILISVNFAIYQKEVALRQGAEVILELAPVDPRSLMQGDYMQLNYKLASQLPHASDGSNLAYLTLDQRHLATQIEQTPGEGKIAIRYQQKNSRISFGVDSYFFQEGQAKIYSAARYGRLKVTSDGMPILTDLLDENLKAIRP